MPVKHEEWGAQHDSLDALQAFDLAGGLAARAQAAALEGGGDKFSHLGGGAVAGGVGDEDGCGHGGSFWGGVKGLTNLNKGSILKLVKRTGYLFNNNLSSLSHSYNSFGIIYLLLTVL